jgi:hypothetical protein
VPFMTMKINDIIVATAEEFEGLVEVKSNAEWDDPKTKGKDRRAVVFEEMIKRAGHQDGWPYCMSFCEGVWRVSYEQAGASSARRNRIAGLLNPSVMKSFRACADAGLIERDPVKGAIMFMQKGGGGYGHAGIVVYVEANWFFTIEANTSPSDPDDRDGGIGTGGVWRKKRIVTYGSRPGLHLRGFVHPLTPQ